MDFGIFLYIISNHFSSFASPPIQRHLLFASFSVCFRAVNVWDGLFCFALLLVYFLTITTISQHIQRGWLYQMNRDWVSDSWYVDGGFDRWRLARFELWIGYMLLLEFEWWKIGLLYIMLYDFMNMSERKSTLWWEHK